MFVMSDKAVMFHAGNYLDPTERHTQSDINAQSKIAFTASLKISFFSPPNTGKPMDDAT